MPEPFTISEWRPAVYKKRDICPCGYGVLRDEIPLGTQYKVDMASIKPGKHVCGGCGSVTDISLVWVKRVWVKGGFLLPGWLPLEIFELQAN